MLSRRYWLTLLTVSAFTAAPLSLVAAAEPLPSSPEAGTAAGEHTSAPRDNTPSPPTSPPSASTSQRRQDDASIARNPEADRQDMELRYPVTPDVDTDRSEKSKEVGS